MKKQHDTVGAFEAKTHLAELLESVRNGHTVTITKRGRPVARLVPCRDAAGSVKRKKLLEQFDAVRNGIKGKINIREFINEGRQH